ncbi:MAG: hypothetical protein CSA89_01015 [Bacteroidales bacterium]|nr:MAG: hypothetical protein CSA89_01015 [Bacteroidales bacterium]
MDTSLHSYKIFYAKIQQKIKLPIQIRYQKSLSNCKKVVILWSIHNILLTQSELIITKIKNQNLTKQ